MRSGADKVQLIYLYFSNDSLLPHKCRTSCFILIPFLLLLDYLVFLLFLSFPPTLQPLEMLAADFRFHQPLLAGNLLPFGLSSKTLCVPYSIHKQEVRTLLLRENVVKVFILINLHLICHFWHFFTCFSHVKENLSRVSFFICMTLCMGKWLKTVPVGRFFSISSCWKFSGWECFSVRENKSEEEENFCLVIFPWSKKCVRKTEGSKHCRKRKEK